jgi:transcriptional regulator with XRE-family HTH domain
MDVMSTLLPAGDATTFGALLRAARACRGLSIQELSDGTSIPRCHVEALEQGDLGLVPPGLYRRAEVRAYAECVGLDVPFALAQLRSVSAPPAAVGQPAADPPAPQEQSQEEPSGWLVQPKAVDSGSAFRDVPPVGSATVRDALPRRATLLLAATASGPRAATPLASAAVVRQPRVVGVVALAAFCAGVLLGERAARDLRSEDQIDGESLAMPEGPPFARLARLAANGAAELTASVAVADDEGAWRTSMLGAGPGSFARPSARPAGSEFGVLVVHTRPEGARVTVNGIGRGITPVTIRRLLLGSQRVRAAKDGYISAERVVLLGRDGLTESVRMELRPLTGRSAAAPRGDPVLVVMSHPEGARVTVNGIAWGMTPITVRHLPQGPQRVRLSKDQYLSEERVVQLAEGRNNTVNVSLRSMR